MFLYDNELQILRRQMDEYERIESNMESLYQQRYALCDEVRKLDSIRLNEQADVDRLKGRNLTTLIHNITGKIYEMQDKEGREAYRAETAYDEAMAKLKTLDAELERHKAESARYKQRRRRYRELLEEKAAALNAGAAPGSEAFLEIDKRLTAMKTCQENLRRSIRAGEAAFDTATEISKSLYEARMSIETGENYGLILNSLLKDDPGDHLIEAQYNIEQLRRHLNAFRPELVEMKIEFSALPDLQAHYRQDPDDRRNLYEKIKRSQTEILSLRDQIKKIVALMEEVIKSIDNDMPSVQLERDNALCPPAD